MFGFPPSYRKKKKTCQWKVNSHKVPRKAIIGPSGRTEGRNGPVGDKVALTSLQTCGQPWAEGYWPLLELGMATPTSALALQGGFSRGHQETADGQPIFHPLHAGHWHLMGPPWGQTPLQTTAR